MRALVSCSIALALCAGPLSAQKSEAEVREDIAFAKGLAEEPWGFVDLAEQVIGALEISGLTGKLSEEVALLRCQVYYAAAKSDAARREELLKKALEAYQGFIDRNPGSTLKPEAEAGLVDASNYYGRVLALKLEDAIGEDAKQLRATLQKVLEGAVGRVNGLIDPLERIESANRTEAQSRRLYELLLTSGELCLSWAKIQEVGTANYQRAIAAFTKLSDYPGEGTPWSLRAMIGIGDVYTAQANAEGDFTQARKLYEEAAAYYEFAVNFSVNKDVATWKDASKEMTQDEKQSRFLFVQLGTPGLLQSLTRSGDSAGAVGWGLHFYNTYKREGLNLIAPPGYLGLLEVARTLIDAGGFIGGNSAAGETQWFATQEAITAAGIAKSRQKTVAEFALALAQQTAADNKGSNLQVRAQKVIGEIVSLPGVNVDPSVLFDAAQGEFNESNWAEAIADMRDVVAALQTADGPTRQEMMPKVLWHMARSYQRMERNLEAAAVYEAALDQWRGDPQFDTQSAKGFFDCASALKRSAKGEALFEEMVQRAERLVLDISKNSGNADAVGGIQYRKAEKLVDDKKYAEAKVEYAAVPEISEYGEKAKVQIGVCEYRLGNFAAAGKLFEAYERYLAGPESVTTDAKRLARRKEALAVSTYFWGLSLYELANAGEGPWQKVVDRLGDYHTRFPEQTQFAPAALYRVLVAHARMEQYDKVRAILATMLQLYADNKWTGQAATESYKILSEKHATEQDPAKKLKLLREMAENLQTFNKTSSTPVFGNLKKEANHWKELAEWSVAEELLERIRTVFAKDAAVADDMAKFVLPDLGEVLVMQKKVAAAAAVLEPLMDPAAPVKANRNTAYLYSIAVTGWIEFEDNKVKEIVGAATNATDFDKGFKPINQLADATDKWTAEWYRYKAQQIYSYLRAVAYDGKRLEVAKTLMAFMTTQVGTQYKADTMPEDVRQLFLWLATKIK